MRSGLGVTEGSLAVFDTGGGSTEFTFGQGLQVEEQFSLQVGAVPYTERYGLAGQVAPEVLDGALAAIGRPRASMAARRRTPWWRWAAVTNITAVRLGLAVYDPDAVQGAVLDRAEIDRQIERYRSRDAEARRAIVGLQPKRADVILAGACIVRTVMDKLGPQTLTVSDGLRHGLLVDRFS